jgi:iron complex outermembrane receptor protein
MFKMTSASCGLMLAMGASLALPGLPASAQQQLERVEITGSAIRRIDAESALPVQVLRRDDIARSGATSVSDLLQRLPAIQRSWAAAPAG